MPKSMARPKRSPSVDTEDRVMERVVEVATWMENHRRTALLGFLTLAAAAVAVYFYLDYRAKLEQTASVRLQEVRLAASGADFDATRAELSAYIDQYGATPHGNEARLLLGSLEMQRDSLAAAIRALEPVADLGAGRPDAFTAAGMVAAAYEQEGEMREALGWWTRIENAARFDYQRHGAMAERARILTAAGRYDEAITLYETLVGEVDAEEDDQFYRVRLGEVIARRESGAPPPAIVPQEAAGVPSGRAAEEDVPAP